MVVAVGTVRVQMTVPVWLMPMEVMIMLGGLLLLLLRLLRPMR